MAAHLNGNGRQQAPPEPGPVPPPPLTPDQAREKIKELRVANKLQRATLESQQLKLAETMLQEAWGGWFENDGPGMFGGSDESFLKLRSQYGHGWVPLATPGDRRAGAKWPVWRHESELNRLRQTSRVLCATNPGAKALQKNLTNYVIGKGFTYKVAPDKEKAKKLGVEQGTVEAYADAVQEVVDEFCALNRWNTSVGSFDYDLGEEEEDYADTGAGTSREREIFRRVNRDGEVFIRFFFKEDGRTEIRFVDPECVTQGPPGWSWQKGWAFGCRFRVDPVEDLESRLGFWVKPHDSSSNSPDVREHPNGEYVSAWCMCQIMSEDEDAEVMRGTPFYSFAVAAALLRAESLQEAISITSRVRARTAEIWQHAYGTRQEISSMATGLANGLLAGSTGPDGTYPYGGVNGAGQTRRVPAGQEMKQPPDGTGTAEFMAVAKGDLGMVASAAAAPSFMVGDGDASNFAQASEEGVPFVRNGESEQEHYKGHFLKIIWRALKHAARCKRIVPEALQVIEIQVEAPQIHKNDDAAIAQKNSTLNQAKVLSPQTWMAKEGLDEDQEVQNWKKWAELGLDPNAGGGGMPPGGGMPGEEDMSAEGQPGAEEGMPGMEQPGGTPGQPGSEGMPPEGQPGAEEASGMPQDAAQQPGGEQGGQDQLGPPDERLDAMADILGGAYGDDALKMQGGEGQQTRESLETDDDLPELVEGFYLLESSEDGGELWEFDLTEAARPKMPARPATPGKTGTPEISKSPHGGHSAIKGATAVPVYFTGMKRDKIGRKEYYVRGKHVKGPEEFAQATGQTPSQAPAGKTKVRTHGIGEHGFWRGFRKKENVSKDAARRYYNASRGIQAALNGDRSIENHDRLVGHLAKLTLPQLHQLKKAYGLKASARFKAQLIQKLGVRLRLQKSMGPQLPKPGAQPAAAPAAAQPMKAAARVTQLAPKQAPKTQLAKDEDNGQPTEATATGQPEGDIGRGGSADAGKSEADGGPVAPKVARPGDTKDGQGRQDVDKPVGEAAAKHVPASVQQVNQRIDRYEKFFRTKGNHQVADWMGKLRAHVNAVGSDAALASLGSDKGAGDNERTQYEGGWDSMGGFATSYLNRYGITPITGGAAPDARLVSSTSPAFGGTTRKQRGDFTPKDPTLKNKLEEAKTLPGLESSEDINTVAGKPVKNLTDDVLNKMDEKYGKGRWIVKAYGEEAAAGYGIFFPQRAAQIKQDAQGTIWGAGEQLAKYGFGLRRDDNSNVVGLQHKNGDTYDFGSQKYNDTIQGDARHWGDRAAEAAPNEHGAQLPGNGKEFMAQPAFAAVGVSDADRAAGKTIAPGEGRVHIVTRNGKAEIVPYSTWIKGEHLPVVFEDDDTKAMAKAAQDAINAMPESERKGQIYAPDIIKSEGGYKVVEANPANDTGSSGYLGDNPFIVDSYVSHLTNRAPAHVQFIRKLLSERQRKQTQESREASRIVHAVMEYVNTPQTMADYKTAVKTVVVAVAESLQVSPLRAVTEYIDLNVFAPWKNAVMEAEVQQGYTGVITDKIGRKYYYVNGVRVKGHEHEAHVKVGGKSDELQHEKPLEDHEADAVAAQRHQEILSAKKAAQREAVNRAYESLLPEGESGKITNHEGRIVNATEEVRIKTKKHIVKHLGSKLQADETKLGKFIKDWNRPSHVWKKGETPAEDVVALLVEQWATTSNDHDAMSRVVQNSAAQLFDLDDTFTPEEPSYRSRSRTDREANAIEAEHGEVLDAYLKVTYEHTQKTLEDAGIEEMVLYRGMVVSHDANKPLNNNLHQEEMQLQPLSSFSRDMHIAQSFAMDLIENEVGVIMAIRVPRKQIFSTAISGAGCLNEDEVIVLGGKMNCTVKMILHSGAKESDFAEV